MEFLKRLTKSIKPALKSSGHCPTCNQNVHFVARGAKLRDQFRCSHCGSIPRERALMVAIDTYYPHWRALTIHESSPGDYGASRRLASECSR
ncbi:MAG: hypothetical protein ACKVQQ_04505, partial [Burkholderiales bacterium]